MDIIEINEAFASQVLGCLKRLEISFDDTRVNPNGGAIAVGHPLGASGARLALTAARHLNAIGVATLSSPFVSAWVKAYRLFSKEPRNLEMN